MSWLDLSQRRIAAGAAPEFVAQSMNWYGAVAFVLLCLFVYWDCRRARPPRTLT